MGLPLWLSSKEPTSSAEDTEMWVPSLGRGDPLEKEVATHSSLLAWETQWTEEPGGLLSSRVAKSQT